MNIVPDLLERFPASKLALVALDAEGRRRDWHFGELVARSAGLSGAFAARGVGRGDVVMTLVGNRIEWVLALLACWRMGAVALPCSTMLRRTDLELRVRATDPRLCLGEELLLAELPAGVPGMTLDEVAAALDEDRPQETPADVVAMDRLRSRPDRLHFRNHGRAKRRRPRLRLSRRAAVPGRALVRLPPGRAGLVHDGAGMVEVGS